MLRKRGVKKAQVTMFVILGLVLLIIIALLYFVFLKKSVVKDGFEEPIPEEFKPVSDYVKSCIHELGIEAIKKMGEHGGYINPLDEYLTGKSFKFDIANPTNSELVSLTNDETGAIPYYLHVPGVASYKNFYVKSEAPLISSMELQLSRYINKNLPFCINNFEGFDERGVGITADNDNITSFVKIRDDELEFFVTYYLNITKDEVKIKITGFTDIIRFPLKKYYEYAQIITASELISQYLEGLAKALIEYHAGVDFSRLPPFYARSNEDYVVIWSNSKVKNDIQGLLLSYIPALQVKDTRNYEPIDVSPGDIEAAFYRYLTLEIFNTSRLKESLNRTAVSFFYTDQPINVKVQPSKGDVIRPNIRVMSGNSFIPQSKENNYNFFYDLSFPVIVEIRGLEPNSEIPEYSFLFGLEANIIENKRVLEWLLGLGTVEWDSSAFNITFPTSIPTSSGSTYTPRLPTKSLFCNENTWLSGNITIKTEDKDSGQPLEGVSIIYGCGDYDECWVGSTKLSAENGNAEWIGQLPLCEGGYLTLSKEDYGSKRIMLSTKEGVDEWLATQGLYKKKKIDISVKKITMNQAHTRDSSWVWSSGPITLNAPTTLSNTNEQVILTISQVGFEAGASPVSATAVFGKDGVDKQTIELIPGDYEVIGTYINETGITIPKDCSRVCTTQVGICLSHTYYPDKEIEIKPAMWGGIEIKEGTTGTFSISKNDLDNNEIEFYVLELAYPACIDQLGDMGKVGTYSQTYKDNVWPVFK